MGFNNSVKNCRATMENHTNRNVIEVYNPSNEVLTQVLLRMYSKHNDLGHPKEQWMRLQIMSVVMILRSIAELQQNHCLQ